MSQDLDLLTVEETAEQLKLSAYTVREMIKRGDLKAIKLGKAYRVKRSTLQELINQSESEPERTK